MDDRLLRACQALSRLLDGCLKVMKSQQEILHAREVEAVNRSKLDRRLIWITGVNIAIFLSSALLIALRCFQKL